MELFDRPFNISENLLPYDGVVNYYGKVLADEACRTYFASLLQTISWRHDQSVIYGKTITTKRKVAWYGDKGYLYTYSKTTKKALPWTKELFKLKQLVEHQSNETYNSCLLNLYQDGDEGMSWHSDAEIDLKKDGAIASLSLGSERRFLFKHRQSKEKVTLVLEPGSLMVMKATTQTHWLHSLPKSKKVTEPRINLTFRTIVENQPR